MIRQEISRKILSEQAIRYPHQEVFTPLLTLLANLQRALSSASQDVLHIFDINGLQLEQALGDIDQMDDIISLYRRYEETWREQGRLEEQREEYINIIANLIVSIARKLNPYRAIGEAVTAVSLPDILPGSGSTSSTSLHDVGQAVVDVMNWLLGNALALDVAKGAAEWMLDSGPPWELTP